MSEHNPPYLAFDRISERLPSRFEFDRIAEGFDSRMTLLPTSKVIVLSKFLRILIVRIR
jgi:hypothetical protein